MRKKRILIAEDDPDTLFMLETILNRAGYNVESLSAGSSLVEGKNDWPDLFILDKGMPLIDGIALCKYLRIKKATRNIPIIMISANHKLRQKAMAAGATEFIEKPFDAKQLLYVMENIFNYDYAQIDD